MLKGGDWGKRAAGGPRVPWRMREVLAEIAKRLGEAPAAIGGLVRKRTEASDALHKALDTAEQIKAEVAGAVASERNAEGKPAFPNEQARLAEIARRLEADPGYRLAKEQADRLRAEVKEVEAQLEELGRRHRSDVQVAYLVASLLGAGLREEAEAVLRAYAEGCRAGTGETEPEKPEAEGQPEVQPAPAAEEARKEDGLEEATFRVLEARANERGVVRAVVCVPGGEKAAVFAKNSAAKALLGAVGKEVAVRYRRLDRGLFAVQVRPVA